MSEKEIPQEVELAEIGRTALEVAHSILNCLTVIGPAAGEVLDMLSKANAEERPISQSELGIIESILKATMEASSRIEKNVKGILQFGKGLRLERAQWNVNEILKEFVELLEVKGKFNIAYKLETCLQLDHLTIAFDKHHVVNCLFDLVKNAGEAGARNVVVKTNIEVTPEGSFAEIMVINDGEEIPDDVLSRMFDFKFTTKKKGNGVGLAQVRKIIEAHSGKIEANTSPERTEFRMLLPF